MSNYQNRSNLSYWESKSIIGTPHILIVGAGLTGMFAAYFMKKKFPTKDILILERGSFSQGASTKNAGFACFGSVSELLDDVEKFGVEQMLSTLEMRWKGLQLTQNIFNSSQIGYEDSGGKEVFFEGQDYDFDQCVNSIAKLNAEVKLIIGKNQCFQSFTKDELPFKNQIGGIFNQYEGAIHTGKLYQALFKLCQENSIRFIFGCEIENIITGKPGVFVPQFGEIIASEKLCITVNAFAKAFLPNYEVVPARNQVFVTSVIHNLNFDGCFHNQKGYIYFRTIENRILIGGARHQLGNSENTSTFGLTPETEIWAMQFLRKYIVSNEEINFEYKWSGILAFGSSKKPFIEHVNDHTICGVKMGGMGVAISSEVGRSLSQMIE